MHSNILSGFVANFKTKNEVISSLHPNK